MITAKEARERINALEAAREREVVEEKINKAVERGESYFWLDCLTSQATEYWLKSLGYIVERSEMNDSVKVSW